MASYSYMGLLAKAVKRFWLVYLLAAADIVASAQVPASCPEKADPVCGSDGLSYYNECLATIQGVSVKHAGYCKGSFFEFAAGSSRIVQEAAPKLARKIAPKERATAQLSISVVHAHAADGFVYVGRAKLAPRPHAHHSSINSSIISSSSGAGSSDLASMIRILPDSVSAVRFTPEGDVYIAKQLDQQQLQHLAETRKPSSSNAATESAAVAAAVAAADPYSIPPQVPPEMQLPGSTSSSKKAAAGVAAARPPGSGSLPHTRHLSIMVGTDERKVCPLGPAYPFSAIGQIDFEEGGTPYICSGTLISQSNILTAAHCVWDVDSQSFVDMLSFAPGRYRGAGGKLVNPFGVFKWSYATLMKNYIASDETQGDIAVVQLAEAVPKAAGTLGVRASCTNENNVVVTTAGYPSDQPEGECMTTECTVTFDCSRESTRHTCDTYMGQSGSSFWDSDYYVRGVHVRGLLDEQVNEFTTLSRRVLTKIRQWESRESGGVV